MAKHIKGKDDAIARAALNRRDREILQTLAFKVPVMSLRQLADAFFHGDQSNAARRLGALSERELLAKHRLNSRSIEIFNSPIFRWNPGEFDPNFSRLSARLCKRCVKQPTCVRLVYFAGNKLAALSGIPKRERPKHLLQISHDLGLAGVYLYFRQSRPIEATQWMGENALKRNPREGQIPDAVLRDEAGVIRVAVEFGGIYSAKRIEKFHQHCKSRRLSYELW